MSDARRHWHGVVGDRHEHQNVWVRGGTLQATMARRPSDGRPENERRDSSASNASSASSASTSSADSGARPSLAERRRSSASSSSVLFHNLIDQKRNSTDSTLAARRVSWNEQLPKGGFIGKWWDGYTRGQ